MKKVIFTLLSLLLFSVSYSQSSEEANIRELEIRLLFFFLSKAHYILFAQMTRSLRNEPQLQDSQGFWRMKVY
jgi:hypothetical protein